PAEPLMVFGGFCRIFGIDAPAFGDPLESRQPIGLALAFGLVRNRRAEHIGAGSQEAGTRRNVVMVGERHKADAVASLAAALAPIESLDRRIDRKPIVAAAGRAWSGMVSRHLVGANDTERQSGLNDGDGARLFDEARDGVAHGPILPEAISLSMRS